MIIKTIYTILLITVSILTIRFIPEVIFGLNLNNPINNFIMLILTFIIGWKCGSRLEKEMHKK